MLITDVLADVRRSLRVRRSERRVRAARRGASPRVLVLGTCQGVAVGQAVTLLLPEADVTVLSAFTLRRRFARLADLVAQARGYDAVLASVYLPPFPDGNDPARLAAVTRLLTIPTVVFAAFHPDQVRVGWHADRPEYGGLLGPLGHAHSALALFGHLEGLGVERTLRLFDGGLYRALGYLDMWAGAAEGLQVLGAQAGYDFAGDLARWSRRGCFMHSDNHPKMFVAADIARALLTRAGIPHGACDLDSFLEDTLLGGGAWPVYPPVADHYGVPGNSLFLKVATPGTGPARTYTPEGFVAASHAVYARHRPEALTCERVERWRQDPETRARLLAAAS